MKRRKIAFCHKCWKFRRPRRMSPYLSGRYCYPCVNLMGEREGARRRSDWERREDRG